MQWGRASGDRWQLSSAATQPGLTPVSVAPAQSGRQLSRAASSVGPPAQSVASSVGPPAQSGRQLSRAASSVGPLVHFGEVLPVDMVVVLYRYRHVVGAGKLTRMAHGSVLVRELARFDLDRSWAEEPVERRLRRGAFHACHAAMVPEGLPLQPRRLCPGRVPGAPSSPIDRLCSRPTCPGKPRYG